MKKLICLCFLFATSCASAKVVFEGYYRIEKKGEHLGYLVQRDELNERTKERTISYFVMKIDSDNTNYFGVKAVSKPSGDFQFAPVRYMVLESGSEGPPALTEGTVKDKKLFINVSDISVPKNEDGTPVKNAKPEKLVGKFELPLQKDSMLSTFVPLSVVAGGPSLLKEGAAFKYNALSEEHRLLVDGEFRILKIGTAPGGNQLIHGLNNFMSEQTEFFMLFDGQVLGYRDPSDGTVMFLVATREKAVGQFSFPKDQIKRTFGDIPFGLVNPVSKSEGKLDVYELIQSNPIPSEKTLKGADRVPANKSGRKTVSK